MAVKLSGITKHGGQIFPPNVSIGFDDEHAEDYIKAMGWGEATDEEPVITYPEGSLIVDPQTVYADGDKKGQLVMPHLAQQAAQDSVGVAPADSNGAIPVGDSVHG